MGLFTAYSVRIVTFYKFLLLDFIYLVVGQYCKINYRFIVD